MKRVLTYLLIALILIACGEGQGENARVTGTIKGLGNDTILIYGEDQMFDWVDTLYVRKDKIKRDIAVDTLAQTWMLFKDGRRFPLFLNKRAKIKIKGDTINLMAMQVEDKGENHLLTEFRNLNDSVQTIAQVDTFITHHPASIVGFYLINKYLLECPPSERLEAKPVLEKMDEGLKEHPQYLKLIDQLLIEQKADTGTTVTYFRVKNLKDEWVSRSNNFNNKWLLIHFWASWDDASQRLNRMVYKPIYKDIKKEKDLDFGMLGISLDVDRNQWKQVVDRDTLEWEQGCDSRGWNTETVNMFSVRTLPANVLISPDGKIKAYNLSQAQIETKIKELKEENKKEKEKEKERKRQSRK